MLVPFAILYTLGSFCLCVFYVAAPAMLGDIADHGRLLSGQERGGTYAAAFSFITKSLAGVAVGLGLAVVGWFGFDATVAQQSASGAFGIKLVSAWLPAAGLLSASLLLWRFPIDRASVLATQQRLYDCAASAR